MNELIDWIDSKEAAEIMRVETNTVAYLCREKLIECRKFSGVWQISRESAENYERTERGKWRDASISA